MKDLLERMINIDIKDEDYHDNDNKTGDSIQRKKSKIMLNSKYIIDTFNLYLFLDKAAADMFAHSLIKNESYKLNLLLTHASNTSNKTQEINRRGGINIYDDSSLKEKLLDK